MKKSVHQIDFLKRKLVGKSRLFFFELVIEKLKPYFLLGLEKSDLIIEKLSNTIYSSQKSELIKSKSDMITNSILLSELSNKIQSKSKCYLFTDDYEYCGLSLVEAKKAIDNSLKIARKDKGNTCFLLDVNFLFYVVINYYDESHNDYPSCFEISVKGYKKHQNS